MSNAHSIDNRTRKHYLCNNNNGCVSDRRTIDPIDTWDKENMQQSKLPEPNMSADSPEDFLSMVAAVNWKTAGLTAKIGDIIQAPYANRPFPQDQVFKNEDGEEFCLMKWRPMIVCATFEDHFLAFPLSSHNGNGTERKPETIKQTLWKVKWEGDKEDLFVNENKEQLVHGVLTDPGWVNKYAGKNVSCFSLVRLETLEYRNSFKRVGHVVAEDRDRMIRKHLDVLTAVHGLTTTTKLTRRATKASLKHLDDVQKENAGKSSASFAKKSSTLYVNQTDLNEADVPSSFRECPGMTAADEEGWVEVRGRRKI